MNKKFYVVTLAIFLMLNLALAARAQSALDGFEPNANGIVQVVVVQPDGKILIGGDFTVVKGISRNRIARLNPDGSLDALFDPSSSGFVSAIALQADGKILVGGSFNGVNSIGGQTRNYIARLDAVTGLADSFNPNADGQVSAIAVQADGHILAGGQFASIGGQTRNRMARLDAITGLADAFNPAVTGLQVNVILLQTDGKILVGGTFGNIGGQPRSHIARLDPATGLADSFNPSASAGFFAVTAFAVQADGKILAGGIFNSIGGQSRNQIARLDPVTGLADSFNPNPDNIIRTIAVQPDGKILVGGDFTNIGGQIRNRIARLDAVTGLAESFNPDASAPVSSIAVQPDGKILVGGYFVNGIARVETNGLLDQTLNLSIVGTVVYATAVQPDGKILIGGEFTSVLGVTRNGIARLNTDGTLDTAFDPNPDLGNKIYSIAIQADGKILVGGRFSIIGGQARNNIARVDATTGLADSFAPNANNDVFAIALQANGKILVGGSFNAIAGQPRNRIARLDPVSGAVDSFDPNADNVVDTIAVQTDSKILAAGVFSNIGGQPRPRLARLDATTGLADLFSTTADFRVHAIALQPDGKILASGQFQAIGGQTRQYFARLDATTGLADSFNPSPNSTVNSIVLQADGKILAGGEFTSIGGQILNRRRIARLDPTTGLADLFNPDADGGILAVAVQTDGKLLVGGTFVNIGGQSRLRFARLSNDTPALQNLSVTQTTVTWTRGGSSTRLSRVTFESSTDNVNYSFLGNGTETGSNWALTGLNLPTGQNLYIRARGHYRSGFHNGSESITESVRNAYLVAGPTATATSTPTNTATATQTNTPTLTPTNTPTLTPTNTPTNTATNTATNTPTPTPTAGPCTVVTNTNDSGTGSLRNAIICANAAGGVDTISFNIPGAGPHTITPATVLPTITDPVIIDGYTQPGASVNTLAAGNNAILLIELNGTNISSSTGLFITCGGSTVQGLVINRFGTQIQLDSVGGNTITGNFIGTDPSGTAWATLGSGVLSGILANSGSNQLGGTNAADRNIILAGSNFFQSHAIEISGSGSIVQGNYIGTNKDGTAKLGNVAVGVFLANASGSNNTIGGTTGTTPGGACTGACNLISGTNTGIQSNGPGSNTIIQGNFIGTNASGTAAIASSNNAIRFSFLSAGTGHLIGGTTVSARNIISGNVGLPIQIETGPTVTIQGNYIGVATNGTSPVANLGAGLYLQANNTTVGGIITGAGNVIAYSGGLGVQVAGSGISIRGNSIYSNNNLGIDLGSDNVTANDNTDPDTGPNNLQNYPVVTSAAIGSTTVGGTLNSSPGQSFSIDVYSNSVCDPSGYGEGQTYLGTATSAITDGLGNASFTVTVPAIVAGQPITATATDAGGNTSEFSLCFTPAASTPTATNTSTPTPTPAETPSVSGTVIYGNPASPTTKFISNAEVSTAGLAVQYTNPPGPTAGQYTMTGFESGLYIVSVSKSTGQNGISSADAARIAQHVSGVSLIPTDRQKIAADVTNNGAISSTDAAQIARFVTALGPPVGLTSQWRFFVPDVSQPTFPIGGSPTTRFYIDPTGNQTGQDYIGILVGDVTGNWNPTAARGVNSGQWTVDSEEKDSERQPIAVAVQEVLTAADKEIVVPVTVEGIADKEVISYEFDLRYDPSMMQPLVEPVDVSGTVSRGLSVVTNATEPGLLRVVVYGAYPIDGDGVLLNLRFTSVGAVGSVSPISFERIMFNEGESRVIVTDGKIELF
ncbi:MAG: hypothetical protein IPL32_05005 [Chloracidobacterium sp.]|nr:hypothetical protein [Chloracidobacterium sp.]